MPDVLSDHNCEGHARSIFRELDKLGYQSLLDLRLLVFADIGLPPEADDETVWTTCQQRGYLLLTGNRNTSAAGASLELVMRRLATDEVLPILTIGDLRRALRDPDYIRSCATTMAEIVLNLERFRGVPRLYLP
ncbi:MAG: ACP S-malonyltransferase [Caldilineaceae bacterium]|jgi:hypothetical protein|nr:ACP S-malonyltransferase [Caldilineaceae bacterium]